MKYINKKNKTIKDSFIHAYEGIIYTMIKERNMHIHIIMATIVVLGGVIFQISYVEWLVCLVLIGLVMSLELTNTAIEAVVDLTTTDDNQLAKVAKDASAGAVLVSAIISALVGFVVFLPKVLEFISRSV